LKTYGLEWSLRLISRVGYPSSGRGGHGISSNLQVRFKMDV
jgi:hypothetical protein